MVEVFFIVLSCFHLGAAARGPASSAGVSNAENAGPTREGWAEGIGRRGAFWSQEPHLSTFFKALSPLQFKQFHFHCN